MANSGTQNGAITTTNAANSRASLALGTMAVVGTPIPLANGGTAVTAFTANQLIITDGSGGFTTIAVGTDGQVMIGGAGGAIWASITSSDSSVTVTGGSNSITMITTQATTSQKGGALLASDAEAVAGTVTDKAIVPSSLTASLASPPTIGSTTPAQGRFTSVKLNSTSGPTITTGSGVPGGTAPLGSIYFRTGGTTTITRAYINTDSGTTWTPLITVA